MTTISRITTGYRKLRAGKVCEDSKAVLRLKDATIIVIADGHGDKRCCYANIGAEIATDTMSHLIKTIRSEVKSEAAFGTYLNDNRDAVFKRFVRAWVKSILMDYANREPGDVDFQKQKDDLIAYTKTLYEIQEGAIPAKQLRALFELRHRNNKEIYSVTLKYGTTVNAVVVANHFVFCIGLGDGDAVAVSGNKVNWMLPKHPQFENTTPSLCWDFDRIEEYFSSIFLPIKDKKNSYTFLDATFDPDMIFLSTDGLRNSFLSDTDFESKLIEIAGECLINGSSKFARKAQAWIDSLTKNSLFQDDITFCAGIRNEKQKQNGDHKLLSLQKTR